MPQRVYSQISQVWSAEQLKTEQPASIYLTWTGRDVADGFVVDLPATVSLLKANLVRIDRQTEILLDVRFTNGHYVLSTSMPITGAHTLIVQVRGDREISRDRWTITPFRNMIRGNQKTAQTLEIWRTEREFRVSRSTSSNRVRALVLESATSRPVEVRRSVLPSLHPNAAFSLSFWIKTVDVGGIVFSTWNGREQNAYPLEVQIDKRGDLVFYRGQQGFHQSLFTPRPIADGQWHHIALVNQPNAKAYLALDGVFVDSLSNTNVPNTFSNRASLSIGNRLENPVQGFQGWLQEIQFWSRARSENAIRSTMRQPIVGSNDAMTRLNFDQQPAADLVASWPNEVKRLPSDLMLRYPIQDFNVTPRRNNVNIVWRVQGEDTRQFIIERSLTGQDFEPVGTLNGLEGNSSDMWRSYSFNDTSLSNGVEVLYYRIRQIFADHTERYSGMIKVGLGDAEPAVAELIGNSPNPFNPQTRISYQLQKPQYVEISVWNLTGNQIVMLVHEELGAGIHYIDFNASDLPSGIYLVRMQTALNTQTLKITLEK
jgi:hypothetical protein